MTISNNLSIVLKRIADAPKLNDSQTVSLLAVSKTFPADDVREAAAAGQRAFGENYVQEGVEKIKTLSDLNLEWHFIGPLQSNKTTPVAQHFDWVHSIDRLKIAERLSNARPADKVSLQVCIQVNTSGEASKSGVSPDDVELLAKQINALPNLTLRGLMTIPEPTDDIQLLRERFALLRTLQDTLNQSGFSLDTLSMGMSDDMEAAIIEGATMVRVGSAIFGYRPRKPTLIK